MKQPLLFLSFSYPQAAVWPFFIWSNLCCFSRSIIRHVPITLFTLSNLCCFYRSIILNARFSHCVYETTIFLSFNYPHRAVYIVYIKRPLLFQQDVWQSFILSNLCCSYRSIIPHETFAHCLYEATFVVFIFQLSPTRRLAIVYMKQPLLFLTFNYLQRAGYPLYILSNIFFIVELSSTRRLHCLHWATFVVFIVQFILNAPFSNWLY